MACEQPKQPAGGGYGRFLAEKRQEIRKSLPEGHKITDVTKKAGELFKALDDAEKKRYHELYVTAQQEYHTALQKFQADGGVVTRKTRRGKLGKKQKKQKDANAPKKPAGGAWGRFIADKRKDIIAVLPKDHKIVDVTKKAAEMWKALDESEKQKYQEQYKVAQAQFVKDMAEYKASLPVQEPEETVTPTKSKRGALKASPRKSLAKDGGSQPAKRGRKASAPEPTGMQLDDEVLAEAKKLGYESQIKNLALRKEIVDSGKSSNDLLTALKQSEGLVNPAKRVLLGGA